MKARPLTISGSKPNKLILLSLLAAVLCILPQIGMSQNLVNDDTAEWFTLGGDYAHTRYTPADEITAENFDELEVAWEWDGSSFNGQSGRSTPTYVDGKLFTVSGARRNVLRLIPRLARPYGPIAYQTQVAGNIPCAPHTVKALAIPE